MMRQHGAMTSACWARAGLKIGLLSSIQGAGSSHGSGLGLAFCKLVVEQLGGRIWADSSPLGGTRIAFELPPAPAEVSARPNQVEAAEPESRVA